MQEAERAGGERVCVSEVVHNGWNVDFAVGSTITGGHTVAVAGGISVRSKRRTDYFQYLEGQITDSLVVLFTAGLEIGRWE